jgi:hypothetical protein
MRRDNLSGRFAVFAPALDHSHLIELIGALAAGAMLHARNHE